MRARWGLIGLALLVAAGLVGHALRSPPPADPRPEAARPATETPPSKRTAHPAEAPAPQASRPAESPLAQLEARIATAQTQYCAEARHFANEAQQWLPLFQSAPDTVKARLMPGLLAQEKRGERLGQLALERLELQLKQEGSERALALADHLLLLRIRSEDSLKRLRSQGQMPVPDDPAARRRIHERAQASGDPMILMLANLNACNEPGCPNLSLADWPRFEPDNGLAWQRATLSGEQRLDRLLAAPRGSTHWPAVRELLNRVSPPQWRGAADFHLEVALIGLEAFWPTAVDLGISKHCRDSAPGSATAHRCLLAAERLWGWSEQPHDHARLMSLVKQLGPLDARWSAREQETQALVTREQRWGMRMRPNPLAAGCYAPDEDEQWLFAWRREGRIAMLQRALREQGLGAEPPPRR